MLDQISEVMLSWSKLYIVEIMHYTLACMMMLEDFPEGKGRPIFSLFFPWLPVDDEPESCSTDLNLGLP